MSDNLHVVCPHCDGINRVPAERLVDGGSCGRCHKPLFTSHPLELTSANFERHTSRSDVPALVDFWAPWCGPCRMMAPALDEAAQRLEPRLRIAKVNTEEQPVISQQYNIRSIPTLALFQSGREIARMSGAMPLPQLMQWLRQHISI